MTEPVRPDDRELEQYLEGGSKLSARYREAGGETAPPELDEVILAQAKAELRRKPNLNRYLAPVALAASLVLAVNLAWNVYQVAPLPERVEAPAEADARLAPEPAAPSAAAPVPRRKAVPPPAPAAEEKEARETRQVADTASAAKSEPHALAEQQVQAMNRARQQLQESAPAGAAAPADAAPLSEAQKVDRLVAYIAGFDGAVFIRNGKEHTPAEAAEHMAYKRKKAGDRVKTADDFIRLCASHSYLSGDAYLIRFADGRTRTAEDVLREELARIDGR